MLARRRGGLSLAAAVQRAEAPQVRSGSVFAELRRLHPLLRPQVLSRRTLVSMSHAIEDECAARAADPVLFGGFQRERFLRASYERWRELARTAQVAVVFADLGDPAPPNPGGAGGGPAPAGVATQPRVARRVRRHRPAGVPGGGGAAGPGAGPAGRAHLRGRLVGRPAGRARRQPHRHRAGRRRCAPAGATRSTSRPSRTHPVRPRTSTGRRCSSTGWWPTSTRPADRSRSGRSLGHLTCAGARARRAPTPSSRSQRLWRRYGAYRTRFVGAVAASTVNKVADVVPELLIGAAVDVVVRGDASFVGEVLGVESRFAQLGWLAVINAVVWIVESVSQYVASVLWRGLAQGVEHDLRVEAYDHVQHLDLGWHESRPAGSTLATLNDDVNQLERFLDVGAPAILQTTLNVLLVGAVFAAASGQLLVLAFLPIPLIVVGSLVFQRRLEPLYDRVRVAVADLSSTLSSNISGIATIKAFTAEDRERDRVAAVSQAYREANTEAIRSSAAFVPLVRMAILAGFTCTLLLGGWATLRGDLEVGLYSVLVFMTQRLLWPLTEVAEVLDLYQRGRASAARILGLLQVPVTVPAGATALERPVAGRVELRGVRAGYADGPDVLHGIDLVVPAGETHAIVGSTGSGQVVAAAPGAALRRPA